MPKNRNRTVTNNFEFPPEFLKTLPYPEKVKVNSQKGSAAPVNPLSFGEPVASQYSGSYRGNKLEKPYTSSSSSECDNATSGISDYDIISFGKSSSSSISWSDELDTEATQRVQNELERMERVLQRREAIPAHYNRDEYEQWIKTFPQLSITGVNMKCPMQHKQSHETPNNKHEEIFAFHSDMNYLTGNCDSDSTSSELKNIHDIKNTVIEQVFQSITTKLLSTKSITKNKNATTRSRNQTNAKQRPEQLNPNSTQNLAHDFDSFLQISPVLLRESGYRSNHLETRQPSSNSVSRSEKMASKWMREEPIEYSSLPYVPTASAKNKPRKAIGRKNSTSSKTRYSSKLSPHRNNYVSLPPIKTLRLPSAKQYRSISATPRHPAKGLSAASVQGNSLLGSKKSQFEVTNYFIQNDLEPTKKILKHLK